MTDPYNFKKRYPKLLESKDFPDVSRQAMGARNLRILLKEAFPGRKFSVKSTSYSGGSSIYVEWDGRGLDAHEEIGLRDRVSQLADLFQYGSFDGMTDSYSYASGEVRAFCDRFGAAKYCLVQKKALTSEEKAKEAAKGLNEALPRPASKNLGPRL